MIIAIVIKIVSARGRDIARARDTRGEVNKRGGWRNRERTRGFSRRTVGGVPGLERGTQRVEAARQDGVP